ncbi:hypothetical protein ACU6U9_06065 [Pseudomonas sp. HK3]
MLLSIRIYFLAPNIVTHSHQVKGITPVNLASVAYSYRQSLELQAVS